MTYAFLKHQLPTITNHLSIPFTAVVKRSFTLFKIISVFPTLNILRRRKTKQLPTYSNQPRYNESYRTNSINSHNETFRRNIERNDVANGRNIARNGASKWLSGHNVRPLEVKKDIVIVCDHVKQGEVGTALKEPANCGFSDSDKRFGQQPYIKPMTLSRIRIRSLFHYMTDKDVQWSVLPLICLIFEKEFPFVFWI